MKPGPVEVARATRACGPVHPVARSIQRCPGPGGGRMVGLGHPWLDQATYWTGPPHSGWPGPSRLARPPKSTRMLKLHGEVNLTSGVLKHCMTRGRKYSLGLVACLHGLRSALMARCCFARVAVHISPQRGPPPPFGDFGLSTTALYIQARAPFICMHCLRQALKPC